ncbi:uncharacterized protein ATC70_011523 [Mucor velutinosus]|uniref:Reverse transcriptase domain-containing protein n=3 Tax=Mucor velutinosus TaxID=708070 RepID=A0AAN7DHB2_9FUNG|nr:hypothetical protein ATC70_000115 [Mucor velutinosus]KAK4516549.1 hypothetical protein ATC70_011523 [Mucor velutinosus]
MPPIYILNIYAHSDDYRARNHLFDQIISLLNSMPEIIPSLIIAGDMNCCFDSTSQRYNRQTGKPKSFIEFLNTHFSDCLNQPNLPHDYTFRRGSSLSTLDYMFAGRDAFFKMSDGDITFLSQEWTDHALLTKTYTTGMTNCGKGVWRANPFLAKNPIYVNKLNTAISNYVETKLDPNLSAQEKWDLIKKKTKQVTLNFSRTHCSWRKAKIKKLQSERNNLLRRYRDDSVCLNLLLSPVEKELSQLQQEIVDVQRLRAGQRWHEKSEKSPGYIKQTLAEKASKRTISSLKHPTSGEQCLETSTKLDAAKVFYQDLYTEEEIDLNCVERMLQYIDKTIPAEDSQDIIEDIPYEDIIQGSRRTPNGSSPGLDGICYEILHLLVINPSCEAIILQVFNDALSLGKFPKSWQESCIVLLPKKGDMTDLGNYRPITLIASDCKVFTRLLNSRVIEVASDLIGPHQSGFLRGRYIGDHGMSLKVIVDNAREARWNNSGEFVEYAGIMLDNAKAYDRVHPQYLSKVLVKFGFPKQFVQCICKLFFDNSIYVNVNGFLTDPIEQRRGIRQGDSISPMLFNLAIEPFLLSVTKSTTISGYSLQHVKPISKRTNSWVAPPPLKVLAYADDVLTFVKSRAELLDLEERLRTYNKASNSKINYDKSVAFPLHGGRMTSQTGGLIQDHATNNLKIKWYDSTSTGFIKYLGYPIWFCNQQRDVYIAKLLGDITTAVERFAARQVSLYGRANIANTMILSKLWHVIRIVSLPKDTVKKITSIIYQFVMSGLYPPLKGNSLFLPRYQGGLGLIDIMAQQKVLQFRYLNALLTENSNNIPGLTYRLLVDYLKMSHDSPSHIIPILFQTARYKNQLRGFHPYHMMFEAIDTYMKHSPFSLAWSVKPNVMTLLSLPVLEILDFVNEEVAMGYTSRDSIRESKVHDFFHVNQETSTLQIKPRSECKRPNIRNQIERGLLCGNIRLESFADTRNMEAHLDLQPFVAMLNYQDRPMLQMSNKYLRSIMLDIHNLDVGRKFNHTISKVQWKHFYHQNMHHSVRNVWYRMIHKQCPSKSALFVRRLRNVEDDKCTLCNDTEDAKHLMVSCPHKNDIWSNIFEQFLGYPKVANPQQVYQSIVNLNLKQYFIYNLDIKITIFDLFAATIRMIWRFHLLQTFEGVPFDTNNVTNKISAEVMRLSDLKHQY